MQPANASSISASTPDARATETDLEKLRAAAQKLKEAAALLEEAAGTQPDGTTIPRSQPTARSISSRRRPPEDIVVGWLPELLTRAARCETAAAENNQSASACDAVHDQIDAARRRGAQP